MAIRLSSCLKRNRFGIYYFRRKIPNALRALFRRKEISRSLRTSSRHNAIVRSQAFGLVTDLFFRKLVTMPKDKSDKPIQADMMLEMELDGIGSLRLDLEPDEMEAGKALINHTLDKLSPFIAKKVVQEAAESGKPLSAAVDDYLAEFERSGRRPESVLDYRGDFNQFTQILGDMPVADLKHEALNDLKKKLTALPPNINKAKELRGKTIDEIIALNLPPQSTVTVQKKWSRLQAFLEWAVGQGYVEKNYAKGKKPKAAVSTREKFSDEDLEKLFECPLYAGALYAEAFKYWIPLIAAYTGARLEEIAQLHLADIKRDDETNIWCIEITEEIAENGGAKAVKKLKNAASVRACPLHSRLKEAGLLEYVSDLRAAGHDRLFPELSLSIYGKAGARASEYFTEFRRACGVGSRSGHSGKVFHSFRHTMNSRLQRAGVAQEIRETLIGHTPQSTNVRVYGDKQFLGRLRDDLEKLEYAFSVRPFVASEQHETARVKAKSRNYKEA